MYRKLVEAKSMNSYGLYVLISGEATAEAAANFLINGQGDGPLSPPPCSS